MRCPRCQFENIPGQDRCLRCGSILDAKVISVVPPRMARWKKPLRTMLRWLRTCGAWPQVHLKIPEFLKIMSANAFLGLILSIIPGLAHLIAGRFREVRWFVLGWLLVLAGGIFFYGGPVGYPLLSIAIVLHAWIAFNHSLSKEIEESQKKVSDFFTLIIVFGLLYWGIRITVFRNFDFTYSTLTIPYQKIQTGDLLLVRRSTGAGDNLPRGTLVVGRFRIWGNNVRPSQNYNEAVGQIVAMPGEKLEITGGQFFVDGEALETDKFPVPQWLNGRQLSTTIPSDSFFVSAAYNVQAQGVALTDNIILDICELRKNDIDAVAIMRWLPVTKRGILRTLE